MREIIFRGKCVSSGEWVEGCFVEKKDPLLEPDVRNAFILAQARGDSFVTWFPVDPATVGQFTGLLDKNGKRIFEGDVVRYGNKTGYVCFGTGCFCVQDSMSQHHPAIDMVMFQWDVIVIGNIHDSELLEVTPNE